MQSDGQGGPLKKWEPLDLSKNDKRFVLSYIGHYHLCWYNFILFSSFWLPNHIVLLAHLNCTPYDIDLPSHLNVALGRV